MLSALQPVFGIVLYGLCLGVGVDLIYRSITDPYKGRRGSWCGRCGYELTSLDSGQCPECGALHRHAGVLTPASHVRVASSSGLLFAGWTFLMMTSGLGILFLLSLFLGAPASSSFMQVSNDQLEIRPEILVEPVSGSDVSVEGRSAYRIDCTSVIESIDDELTSGTCVLSMNNTPRTVTLEIDLADASWRLISEDEDELRSGQRVSITSIEALYEASGIDVDRIETKREIGELNAELSALLLDPIGRRTSPIQDGAWINVGTRGGSSSSMPAPVGNKLNLFDLVLGGLLLVYVIGLFVLFRKRRKTLERSAVFSAGHP